MESAVSATSALLKALESNNPSICEKAAYALGEIGNSGAVAGLISILNHWNCSISERAIEALGKIGNKTAIQPLTKFLQDEKYKTQRPEIHQNTLIALGKLGSDIPRSELLKILEDQSPYIHPSDWSQICNALESIGGKDVVTGLLKALKPSNPFSHLRCFAAIALGNLDDERAIPGLLKALEDEESSVRFHAGKALGKLHGHDQKVIPSLFQLLKNEDTKIREAAIHTLGELRDEIAVPELLGLLETEEASVRYHVIKSLKEIGSSTALDELQRLQKTLDDNFVYTIASIQERCQYYNYELEEERKAIAPNEASDTPTATLARIDQTTRRIDQRTDQMKDEPKVDQSVHITNSNVSGCVSTGSSKIENKINPPNAEKRFDWKHWLTKHWLTVALALISVAASGLFNPEIRKWLHLDASPQVEQKQESQTN